MARVTQNPAEASAQAAFPTTTPSVGRGIRLPTVSVRPTSISPARRDRTAIVAAALGQLGTAVSAFANTKAQIDFKKEQLAINQQIAVDKSNARASLLTIVNNSIDGVQALSDDPFDFNVNEAKDTFRADVLTFMSGERGFQIDNDTLRLALDEGDARAESLAPTTQVSLKGGRITVTQEFDGETKVSTEVVDEDAAALNDIGFLSNTHPIMVQNILNDDSLSFEEKVEAGEELTERIALLRERELMSEIEASRSPAFGKSEVVKISLARSEFFDVLVDHSSTAMSALARTKFDPLVPGAMENLADEFEADMQNILLTDPSATKLTEKYEVDVFNIIEDSTNRYVAFQAEWLRSLDTLNIKKQGAAAAVANMTEATSKLKLEDAIFRGNVISPKQRFFAVAGQNLLYGQMYENQITDAGKKVPEYDHMVKSMALATSRFKDMGIKIRELQDDDSEETRRATQQIMGEFFIDATNWAKRETLDSLDIKGFVAAMSLMRESGIFQRLESENFLLLEEIYERAKAIPSNTAMFEHLENNNTDAVNLLLLESYREGIKRQITER